MSEIRTQVPPIRDEMLRELVQGVASGDPDAFTRLYERFGPVVHGILLLRVGHEEAEDLTQEVFLRLHRGIGVLREASSLPAWICTTARNLATDHMRRQSRKPEQEPLGELAGGDGGENHELATRVLQRLRALPEAYQETLVLRLVEGLTGPEISACTGLTEGSVRVNLCRGMSILREQLRKDGWP
ncbi:MAG: RNA polymerase sigma factor [Planctomycetota bacterium]